MVHVPSLYTKVNVRGFCQTIYPILPIKLADLGLSDNKISKRYVLKRLNLNIKIA